MRVRHAGPALVIAATLAGGLLLGLVIQRGRTAAADRAHTREILAVFCQIHHGLDVTLERIIRESATRRALLQSRYFQEHPDEIAAAQDGARRRVAKLRAVDCNAAVLDRLLAENLAAGGRRG